MSDAVTTENLKNNRTVVIFTRAPLLGSVKSRLAVHVGKQKALEIHLHLLKRTLSQVCGNDRWKVELWVGGECEVLRHMAWVEDYRLTVRQQHGDNLGMRMAHCMESLTGGGEQSAGRPVVLVGSDCTLLDHAYIEAAFRLLESGKDLVFGPAEDGGYVLVAMSAPHSRIFQNISWGGDQVMRQSLVRLAELGLTSSMLATLWDLDTLEDLQRYERELGYKI